MLKLFERRHFPIGIDIGTHAVRMLQLRSQGDALALQAAAVIERSKENPQLADEMRDLFKRGLAMAPFLGKLAVISIPTGHMHAKSVRLPPMPEDDMRQAVRWEAKDRFSFDIENGRLAWFQGGEVRRGTEVKEEVLLFSPKGEPTDQILTGAAAAGLRIAALDIDACAAYRSISHRHLTADGTRSQVAILDIGYNTSQFSIIRDEQLVFYKTVDIGGRMLDDATAQKLETSPVEAMKMRHSILETEEATDDHQIVKGAVEEAVRRPLEELSRELDLCMRYYAVTLRGPRPDRIYVAGKIAATRRILGILSELLSVECVSAQPLRSVENLGSTTRPDRSAEWAVAAGLSLYLQDNAAAEAVA